MNFHRKNPSALGIYCHVPFCATTCDFCAFYQEKPRRGDIERYLAGIAEELKLCPPPRSPETMFWGGGTPGLLPAEDLYFLGNCFLDTIKSPPTEWTVELSPSVVKRDKLDVLKKLGVTRVSLGVQSFDTGTLAALGRQHSPKQIRAAWELICETGFRDKNIDLIFGTPGQGEARWLADLHEAVQLAPEHISTYCLTFEEDAALFVKLSGGKVKIDPECEAALYRKTWAFLNDAGFAQYEISNFAKSGHECIHNLNTWRMHEWLGYGPAAASQFSGKRFQNPASLNRWLAGIDKKEPAHEQSVALTPAILLSDALIFGLRMNEGVLPEQLAAQFDASLPAELKTLGERLAGEDWLNISGNAGDTRWQLTLEGRLRADAIGSAILEIFD